MSDNSVSHRPFLVASLLTLCLTVLCPAAGADGKPDFDLCATAGALTLNTTLRSGSGAVGDLEVFFLDVPAAGILTLDVSAPADGPTQPKLTFLDSCTERGGRTQGFHLIRETPAGLVLEIRLPGWYFLRVSSEDPRQPLPRYKLQNVMVAGLMRPDGESHTKVAGCEVDETEEDVILCSLKSPPVAALCASGEVDDHGDTPLCATPIRPGHHATGNVENAFGDDEDFFTFVLDAQETVEIEIREAVGAGAVLYDESGQRLASSAGDDSYSRIVRTLHPGRYFVRVESWYGAGDPYVLSVARLNRLLIR